MNDLIIRKANVSDAKKILSVYSYYVEKTAISFEYDVPTTEEFEERIRRTTERYPYFVAEVGGRIIGYAYAGAFIKRAAYAHCAETTVYVERGEHKKGVGKALYNALENALKDMGIKNLYACVAVTDNEDEYLTNNSSAFHEHYGFRIVGVFRRCGYKFKRWYDMVWMEKLIDN